MELNLPVSVGVLVAIIALGAGGLIAGDMMALETVTMMVLPSMVAFAAIVFVIGVKHGEYRAGT
jgi:hypothetical protein